MIRESCDQKKKKRLVGESHMLTDQHIVKNDSCRKYKNGQQAYDTDTGDCRLSNSSFKLVSKPSACIAAFLYLRKEGKYQ